MIAHLSGTILYKELKYAIIQTNGVGYKVSMIEKDLEITRLGEHISVWVYTAVREDAIDLYGFIIKESREMFDSLLIVSGIGPKTALGILNAAGHEKIRDAVVTGEISYLTSISGVGKKAAEKIVLELKGKIGAIQSAGTDGGYAGGSLSSAGQSDIDTIEALKSLGYTHKEAKEALEKLSPEVRAKDTGDKIKALLKVLN
jgi:Holliday junction DNA helicase RuvA